LNQSINIDKRIIVIQTSLKKVTMMNIWDRITGKLSSPLHDQVRRLDPHIRQSLSAVVQEGFLHDDDNDDETQGHDLQAALRDSTEQLHKLQEREQFLGIRIQQYRKALEKQRDHWQAEQKRLITRKEEEEEEETIRPEDLEEQQSHRMTAVEFQQAEAALQRRWEKWQGDEDALASIIETHKVILASCERMRRTVVMLHEKEQRILQMRGDCEEFLETAAELEQASSERRTIEEEERVNVHEFDDESERNGTQHHNAEDGNCATTEDGHLEDVAV
jgi:hypothetical protein